MATATDASEQCLRLRCHLHCVSIAHVHLRKIAGEVSEKDPACAKASEEWAIKLSARDWNIRGAFFVGGSLGGTTAVGGQIELPARGLRVDAEAAAVRPPLPIGARWEIANAGVRQPNDRLSEIIILSTTVPKARSVLCGGQPVKEKQLDL